MISTKYSILSCLLVCLLLGPTVSETNVTAQSKPRKWRALVHAKHLRKDYRRLKKQEGAIKLVGGEKGPFEGNVEILHQGRWGNVCDDEWDEQEARLVCKQLGYGARGAQATGNARFGQARRRFWMDGVLCEGSESSLAECRFDGWGKTDCKGNEAAGVICQHKDARSNSSRSAPPGSSLNLVERQSKIRVAHRRGIALRLAGPRQGRLEIKLGSSDWGVVCGDGWSLLEAAVICRQLGLGYAVQAYQTDFFAGDRLPMLISGIKCRGNESNLAECLHDNELDCPGVGENVAGVRCSSRLADLVFDHMELERTAHLEDRQLYWLQCAMEENCVASQAYQVQRERAHWQWESRRLLRFTARILNAGTADFRPAVPKHLWEWHMCHMHYHSMEVFATFDVIDSNGKRVAEGHKASFCLEDNQCLPGIRPRYKCANYGDQGISVNCSDIYKYNIDCQWVDITELAPGSYTFKGNYGGIWPCPQVAVNPEMKVGEMSFDNNAATCKLLYTEAYAKVHGCVMGRP